LCSARRACSIKRRIASGRVGGGVAGGKDVGEEENLFVAQACWHLKLLTSRVSIEIVQKAAIIGTPIIVAVSAPTALAVRGCDAAGITLIAVARQDGLK
jgi:formate dehydrogenase accessory protein FdhD